MTTASSCSPAAAAAVISDEWVRHNRSPSAWMVYQAAAYRYFGGTIPPFLAPTVAAAEDELGAEGVVTAAAWVADNAAWIESRAGSVEALPLEEAMKKIIRHWSPGLDDGQVASAVAEAREAAIAETSVAAAVAVVVEETLRQNPSPESVVAYAGAAYRHFAGAVPAHHVTVVEMAEERLGSKDVAAIAAWVAASDIWIANQAAAAEPAPEPPPPNALAAAAVAARLVHESGNPIPMVLWAGQCAIRSWMDRFASATPVPPVEPLVEMLVHGWVNVEDRDHIARDIAAGIVDIDAQANGTPTCSTEAAAAVVIDEAEHHIGNLVWVLGYAGALYRHSRTVPPHAAAIAMAESALGDDNLQIIKTWLNANITRVVIAGRALDALRELEPPPPPIPAEALAAGAVAERLAEAAGDPLTDIVWAGVCAELQWRIRYGGVEEPTNREVFARDPIANVARQYLEREDARRVARGVGRALAEIDALAGGDFRRDSDGSGLDRNDRGGGGFAGV